MKNEVAHSTHYQSLIDLCTDFDKRGVVATWQKNRGDNATYRSSAISTQMLKAIGQYIDDSIVDAVCLSSILAIMCDEATDLRNRTELSICIQYPTKEGISVESFVHIVPISDAKAETISFITNSIVTTLDTRGIDMTRVVWVAFDGASNMSGRKSGVQAHL